MDSIQIEGWKVWQKQILQPGGLSYKVVVTRGKKWRNKTQEKSLTVTYIHGVMLNLIDGGQPLGREIVQTWWTAQPC